MRAFINGAVVVLVVAVLVAAAAAGYLWYSTKQQVDQLVAMAKPFAEISYGGIELSPSGAVGVNRVRIAPISSNDSIAIGAIQLKAPNLLALLHTRWQLSRDHLPQALAFVVRDLEMQPGGLVGPGASQAATATPFDHLEALGCGPVTAFGAEQWREMGYDRLLGDLEMGYRVDARNNVLELRADSRTRDLATLNLEVGMALTKPPESVLELATAFTPKLAKLNLVMRDEGFNQRRNAYCAAKAGKPVPDYVAAHVRQVVERLRDNGIALGPGLSAAYQRYLTEGGALTVAAAPPMPINPVELPDYAPADVVKLLGLTLKVNETPVTDLTMNWNAAQVVKALGIVPKPEAEAEVETPAPPSAAPRPAVAQKSFRSVPVGQLSQHVGKIAKLHTATGAEYRGQLDAMAEDVVRITVRKSGGSATLSLRPNEITAAEVLY